MKACCENVESDLPPRIQRLRVRLETDFARMRGHKLVDADEGKTYAKLAYESYSRNVGKPRILRRAEFLAHFAAGVPVLRREDERIVGSQRFTAPPLRELYTEEQLKQADIQTNHGHIIVDYGRSHLHVNIVDADDLKKAKANPTRYQDLTVRISGFSARFVNLDEKWQDAIIERTAQGM